MHNTSFEKLFNEEYLKPKPNNLMLPWMDLNWMVNTINLGLFGFFCIFFKLELGITLLDPQTHMLGHNFIIGHFIELEMSFLGFYY